MDEETDENDDSPPPPPGVLVPAAGSPGRPEGVEAVVSTLPTPPVPPAGPPGAPSSGWFAVLSGEDAELVGAGDVDQSVDANLTGFDAQRLRADGAQLPASLDGERVET